MYVDYDPDLAAIGAIEPVFVEEFDYHATKRLVVDQDIEVTWVSEMSSQYPVAALHTRYEDCNIDVYKTVLKWRSTLVSAVADDPRRGLPLRSEWR